KGRCLIGVRSLVIESKVDVVMWPVSAAFSTPASATTSAASAASAEWTKQPSLSEVVNHSQVDAVTIVVERGHVVKVLCCSRKIRKRKEAQQRLRRWADLACRNDVACEGLPGLRIEDLNWQAAVWSGGKLCG